MKILLLFCLVSFVACSKNDSDSGKTCWECNVSQTETKKGCTEDGSIPVFKDANGNPYGTFNCRKI